ncbi:outer membrane protein [Novosphingobium beihaiensis]|uniref:Porin family protein n=1 Tax=Novosphingobium beihaiensis TaxID=2930389 RepID=A0ABT0BLM4_9SPHN|nr:outer membrane beta-barrel protein [Novosphingobium beihaiensis]MCJ2185947.1 porin family protein [Novosphingobium beihaiensis]
MQLNTFHASLLGFAALAATAAAPVQAQDDDGHGIYGVARAGASFQPKQTLDGSDFDVSDTFEKDTKYKSGLTGEIGAGYDFGIVRVEQTIGYTRHNPKNLDLGDLVGDGSFNAYNLSLNAFVDLPVSKVFVPFVGGGAGVARVDADLARADTVANLSSSYSGKDWGFMWHADAGIGVRLSSKATVELGARYTRISSLKFDGQNNGEAAVFDPKMSTLSGTLGLRYSF